DGPAAGRRVRAVHRQRERHGPRAIGLDADDEDLVGVAREGVPPVGDLADAVRHPGDGRIEVELAPVVDGRVVAKEAEAEVAERLVHFRLIRLKRTWSRGSPGS